MKLQAVKGLCRYVHVLLCAHICVECGAHVAVYTYSTCTCMLYIDGAGGRRNCESEGRTVNLKVDNPS